MKLIYGDDKSYELLVEIFNSANNRFIEENKQLIYDNISERTLCGELKSCLEEEIKHHKIKGYKTDVEYNRNMGKLKTIINNEHQIINIQCDLIVHSRGLLVKQDNLIAIEMKKAYQNEESKDSDRIRLKALTKDTYDEHWVYDSKKLPKHVCRYILGIFYEVDKDNNSVTIEFYKNGDFVTKQLLKF